ncbi:MAG: DUF4136 domain-containing protein [Planctomycetota bacterium]
MRTTALLALLCVAACATGPQIEATARPGVDFSQFQTWDWIPKEHERVPDAFAQNEQADRRLRAAIESHLALEGLKRSPENPDLYVTYVTGVKDSLGETVWGQGYGATGPGRSHGAMNRREAQIIIEFVDTRSMERVWRGWGKITIDHFQDASPIAQEALDALFELYPPK